jgi:hypothetical protein
MGDATADAARDAAADAGVCPDEDGDGFRAAFCGGTDCNDQRAEQYPGAPPLCGNGMKEACPSDPELSGPTLFADDPAARGALPPTALLQDAAGYKPQIAMAATEAVHDYGVALLLALRANGSGRHAPVRWDIPLKTPAEGTQRVLEGESVVDLTASEQVTSLDARTLDQTRIGLALVDTQDQRSWRGALDLESDERQLRALDGSYLDEPGVVSGARDYAVWRTNEGGSTRVESHTLEDPPSLFGTETGVPSETSIRMETTDSAFVMMQDGEGQFWWWHAGTAENVEARTIMGQSSQAAWVRVEGAGQASDRVHLLAYHKRSEIFFEPYDCPEGQSGCQLQQRVNPLRPAPAGAPNASVPDAHDLPDGRVALLVTERHNDGDRLTLQLVESDLLNAGAKIPLLDVRDSDERITDARIDLVQSSGARTVFVAAAVGDSTGGTDVSRIVLTGIRECASD